MTREGDIAELTLLRWEELKKEKMDIEKIREFVKEHFDEPGCELEEHTPGDYDPQVSHHDLFSDREKVMRQLSLPHCIIIRILS